MIPVKQKRIYYVPGLLLLSLLYLSFMLPMREYLSYRRPRTMPIVMPDIEDIERYLGKEKRKYVELHLTGNPREDEISLRFARIEIKRQIKMQDTLRGIHLTFSEECRYGTYVELVNMCNVESVASYGGCGNDFWIHASISLLIPE